MFRRRPFGVTLLLWMVLSLSAWGIIRLLGALRWWDILYEFNARFSPLYLSMTGAGWALAGGILLWSIWSTKAWAYRAIPLSISVWLLEYWIERLLEPSPRANLLFAIAASTMLVLLTVIITGSRNTKFYFIRSEAHEQSSQDSTSA